MNVKIPCGYNFFHNYNIKYCMKIHVEHVELEGIIILDWIQC